jgi:hypothetical protein
VLGIVTVVAISTDWGRFPQAAMSVTGLGKPIETERAGLTGPLSAHPWIAALASD